MVNKIGTTPRTSIKMKKDITYEQWRDYCVEKKEKGYAEAPFDIDYSSYSNEMKKRRVPRMPQ